MTSTNKTILVPPLAEKIIDSLRRTEELLRDGKDRPRSWAQLDLLTHLGLLKRVQRTPARWEITQQGEDVLAIAKPVWNEVYAPGQIKAGDWLRFYIGGKAIFVQAKEIINPGKHDEEVVYNRSKNHYFITRMAIEGKSSHKSVMVAGTYSWPK